MERNGEGSDLGDRNRAAATRNAERERIENERAAVSAEIIDLSAERERRAQENEWHGAVRSGSPPRILETLTERRSTFSRGDLNRELAKVIFDPQDRASLTDRILALPEVVGLRETETAPVSRYTTRTVLADEARVMRDASALVGDTRHGLSAAQGEAALDRYPQVTAERRAAFRELTDAKGLAVLAGEAGTGKSTTLAAVRDAYETAGYRVIGMSWTNQVVQNLRQDGFRDATTLAAELYRLDRGSTRWDSRTVLIVNEAGMLFNQAPGGSDRGGAGGRREAGPRRGRQTTRQHRARRPVWGAQGKIRRDRTARSGAGVRRRAAARLQPDAPGRVPAGIGDLAQRIAAVQEFAAGLVDRYGVAVDFAIHAPDRQGDERNYHAHAIGSGGDNAAAGASRDRLNVQRIDRHDRISAPPVRIAKQRRAHRGAGERPCRHCIAEGNA